MKFRTIGIVAALAGVVFCWSVEASSNPIADFYRDKKISLYVGFGAGGGDLYGRLLARFMGEHIPGRPGFVVRNVPGAQSLILANELYNKLPQDGSVIGLIDRNAALEAIWENPQARFKPNEFNWIGSVNVDVSTCVTWAETGIDTVQEFMSQELVLGTSVFYHANLLNNLFGAKLKQIAYPGGNDVSLAIERGEVQGRCNWSWSGVISTRPNWVREKKINVIMQFAYEKHPDIPDVPLVLDLIRNDSDRQMIDLMLSTQVMARPFLTTPGVPVYRVKMLREAFEQTMEDPAFLDAAKEQRLEIGPVSGEKIQQPVERMSATPKDIVRQFRDAATKSSY